MPRKGPYKFKIDQEELRKFFMDYPADPTPKQLAEIDKVFNIIIIKHYNSYAYIAEDLKSYVMIALLERRNRYDPSYSAYNYIYTIFRNEVTNKVRKLTKETLVDDITSLKNIASDEFKANLPDSIERYREYLTGEKEFTFLRIPQKDVLDIVLFLRLHESRRKVHVPEFVQEDPNSIQVLYKLLKEFIGV